MSSKNPTSNELQKYEGNYSEDAFWKKIKRVAAKAGTKVVYYALVLYYTLIDPNTPTKYKAVIALSEASAFLLSQLKQPKTSAELVSLLTQEFDVSVEQAEADVKEAVEKYTKLGLITNDDQP